MICPWCEKKINVFKRVYTDPSMFCCWNCYNDYHYAND